MGKAIGIDLGTTYSVMAIRKGPRITIIKNALGEELTRSVVASCDSSKQFMDLVASEPSAAKSLVKYDNRQFLVGRIAADIALESSGDERSKNTIFSIKRLIGRSYNDVDPYENRPIVPDMKKRWSYEIRSIANGTDIRVVLGGKEYSPIDISAIILKKLKEDAEKVLGEEVTHAVVTVPAYFSARQKAATREAAIRAGLIVQKLLDEPSASAIAFRVNNLGHEQVQKTVLTYDLGGGTFDVAILDFCGTLPPDQQVVKGNNWLGGDDFDQMIIDHIFEEIEDRHKVDPRNDEKFMRIIRDAAEKIKIRLSDPEISGDEPVTKKIMSELKDRKGNLVDVDISLTRNQFESMIKEKIKGSMNEVHAALETTLLKLTPESIDHVILAGGSTQIPLVQEKLIEIFKKEKIHIFGQTEKSADDSGISVMNCVAAGAALQSSYLGEQVECENSECNYHLNDSKKETCEKCGLRLPKPHIPIAAKPYGIKISKRESDEDTAIVPSSMPLDDIFDSIIEVGDPANCPRREIYRPRHGGVRIVEISVYEGRKHGDDPYHPQATKNEYMGTIWMMLPFENTRDDCIEIDFSLDGNGTLDGITAKCKGTTIKKQAVSFDSKEDIVGERILRIIYSIHKDMNAVDKKTGLIKDMLLEEAYKAFEIMVDGDIDASDRKAADIEQKLKRFKHVWNGKQTLSYARFVVQEYGLFKDQLKINFLNVIEELADELDQAMDAEDVEKIEDIINELDGEINKVMNHPTLRILIDVRKAARIAQMISSDPQMARNLKVQNKSIEEAEAASRELEGKLEIIKSCLLTGDLTTAGAIFKEIRPKVTQWLIIGVTAGIKPEKEVVIITGPTK